MEAINLGKDGKDVQRKDRKKKKIPRSDKKRSKWR